MRDLTIKQWSNKITKIAAKNGLDSEYFVARIEYQNHGRIAPFVEYGAYFAKLGIATITSRDWKLCVKAVMAQISLNKAQKHQ